MSTGAGYLSLNTGNFFWFANGHGSGVLHGPATVSDVFSATAGDFLKLGYRAERRRLVPCGIIFSRLQWINNNGIK